MGPIALFDKSFLQSLNMDESVLFDTFFNANVCPLFYIETLADLNKPVRNPEQEVRKKIANKFPKNNGRPNLHHIQLCLANLMGQGVPMNGRVIVPPSQLSESKYKVATAVECTPEEDAFFRWQREEFSEIERLYSQGWRQWLSSLNLKQAAEIYRGIGIDSRSCKTLEDAKVLAEKLVRTQESNVSAFIVNACLALGIHPNQQGQILEQWSRSGCPPHSVYAPYSTYVLTIQAFFHISLAANQISVDRNSNQVDLFYLFYLPFCSIFVSSDNLHRRCSPLFLRKDQEFVWGEDLRKGLKELNEFYMRLPEETRDQGVMCSAMTPPKEGDFFVSQLWDRHMPGWRERGLSSPTKEPFVMSPVMRKFQDPDNTSTLATPTIRFDPNEAD